MTDGATKKNGMATAAMVLGIISIVLGLLTGWIGAIIGIVAIILAVVAKNQIKADPSMAGSAGQAKGGLIMGIIGAALGIVITILAIMAANALAGELNDRFQELEDLNIESNY